MRDARSHAVVPEDKVVLTSKHIHLHKIIIMDTIIAISNKKRDGALEAEIGIKKVN